MAAIAFTYDVATLVGRVRLYAGDTDGAGLNRMGGDRTRTDAEINFLLAQNASDARAAASELLETRAAEYAQQAGSVTQGHLKQDYTQRSSKCLEAAAMLRKRASQPLAQEAGAKVFTLGDDAQAGSMDKW